MSSRDGWWTRLGPPSAEVLRHRRFGILAIAALSICIIAAVGQFSPWKLLEARIYDYMSTISVPAHAEHGPVIVAIDEPSFAEIGQRWPWPRELHARLIEALRRSGAKAIGLDIIFAEPSEPEADRALAAVAMSDVVLAGDISLIETPHGDQLVRTEPLPILMQGGARLGISSITLDGDGILRRLPRYQDGFAATLLRAAGGDPAPVPEGALLQVLGPPRSYRTVSYYQALDPETFLPPGTFRDRPVIVGLSMQSAPTAEHGGADAYATSWTPHSGRLIAGAEIQATIFDNLSRSLFAMPVPFWGSALALVAAAAAACFTVWQQTGWRALALTLVAAVASLGVSFLFLRLGRLHLSPLGPTLAFAAIAAIQGARDFAAERRLRHSITRAFSQYISPVLVQRLATDPSRLKLGGERRVLTVLFCDIRGFTTIAERMKDDPEGLTTLVNRLLNPLSAAVLDAGGTIDKYIGDAIMAFWNAPLDDPDHAVHAVEAALAMLRAIEELNAELAAEAEPGGPPPVAFRIGIGINTGECVAGNMGSDRRFNYSALGDAVNLASRLEAQTKNYDVPILLGNETAQLASGHFRVAELDRIQVKGKFEATAVWTVVPEADAASCAAHSAFIDDIFGGRADMALGRIEELSQRLPSLAGYYRHWKNPVSGGGQRA